MKKAIHTSKAPAAIGPYSQAIVVNGFLYTAGQIALNPETMELEMADIQTETTHVMTNLKAVLDEAGMDFSNVVKTSIFLSSMDLFASVNEVYGSYFDSNGVLPARETVAVSGLPKGVNVEISLIAFKA
jgi:2-iminobutanoate/2-iminopropanoate deaminase